jgi:hypothetical protein
MAPLPVHIGTTLKSFPLVRSAPSPIGGFSGLIANRCWTAPKHDRWHLIRIAIKAEFSLTPMLEHST